MKRLFLFASYFENGVVGKAFHHYTSCISKVGDIVMVADSDVNAELLESLRPFTLHLEAHRHREYDFGSYKYCWKWAKDNLQIKDYDFIYLINDSVYGPLRDITPYLKKMEGSGDDAACMSCFPGKSHPHMQSWFICLGKGVFLSKWFDEFLLSVRKEDDKNEICRKYETGLTHLLKERGIHYSYLFSAPHKSIYNRPLRFFRQGLPFIKKASFTRHGGSLAYQIRQILTDIPAELRESILDESAKVWGEAVPETIVNASHFRAFNKYLYYLCNKAFRK